LIEQIAYRRGAGDWLAEGTRAAAARLGGGADEFAIHVKGLEMAYHDPRAFVAMAANYATANRGACHLESLSYWRGYGVEWEGWQDGPHDRFASEGAGKMAVDFQNYVGAYNPLGLCKFIAKAGFTPQNVADLLRQAMGWDITAAELLQTGERIFNLKRLINNRLGVTRQDDTLPKRLLTQPRPSGGAEGNLPDLETMLAEYYQARGWQSDGRPSPERLEILGLCMCLPA
jgi:aldehyde:ferredoxin oxidoreductase